MSTFTLSKRLQYSAFFLFFALAVAAALVLSRHVTTFAEQKQRALMIGQELPHLRSQVALLKATVATEKAFGMDAAASLEEQAASYVLPLTPDAPRLIALLSAIVGSFSDALTLESVIVGQPVVVDARETKPVTLTLRGPLLDAMNVVSLLDLSGRLTVSDLLTSEDRKRLLEDIDARSPASLPAVSAFLSADILSVASQPDAALDRVTRDMPSAVAADTRATLLASGLTPVFDVLSPVISSLRKADSWPFPFLITDSIEYADNRTVVRLTMMGRGQK